MMKEHKPYLETEKLAKKIQTDPPLSGREQRRLRRKNIRGNKNYY